jgi:hypothetical protein
MIRIVGFVFTALHCMERRSSAAAARTTPDHPVGARA